MAKTSKKQNKTKTDIFDPKRIAIGERIFTARKSANMTQQQVADAVSQKLDQNGSNKNIISSQSISYWEKGVYLPSTENLILLSEVLGVSVSSLVENHPYEYQTQKVFYDVKNTLKRIKNLASSDPAAFKNTLKALPFAEKAHENWNLKNSDIPYISHPLTMTAHMLAMGIRDDAILAATLLHDVMEDCCYVGDKIMTTKLAENQHLVYRQVDKDDLPVDDETKELVVLLTKVEKKDEDREEMLERYFSKIKTNPKASLIKLVDRCNNISKMSWGLSHERIHRMIFETDKYVLPLLDSIKHTEYDNAKYLLSYQIKTTLDVYKRLM